VRRALVLAVAALAGCHRAAPEPKLELVGAWLREPERTHGFELREDGVFALLGLSEQNGLAWNVAHGELVLSTNTEQRPEPNTVRLAIAALEPDRLVLEARDEPLAGSYRRAEVAHVRGVATYRERIALAPGARVELHVSRGPEPVAAGLFAVREPVPIPFDVSFVPTAGAQYTLTLAIREGDRTLFETPAPLPVTPDGEPLEVLLAATP
jgi:type III secretion system (T3SS) chaperone YscW